MTRRTGSVLLVDDEEKLRKSLGRALRADGHHVVEASDGREAQRLLSDRTFDVVLVDNMMPKVSGLELVRDLVRSTTGAERPQVVMMTAYPTVESATEARRLGAVDYLQKPFEIAELLVVVGRALEHQRRRSDSRRLSSERPDQLDHRGSVGRIRR
jgi:two-component system response regulator AtoC